MGDHDLTLFVQKTYKDMNKYLGIKDPESPRQKLEFSDILDESSADSSSAVGLSDNTRNFLSIHRQNVAGLDIAKKLREKESQVVEAKTELLLMGDKLKKYEALLKENREDYDKKLEDLRNERSKEKEKTEELISKAKYADLEKKRAEDELDLYKDKTKAKLEYLEKELRNRSYSSIPNNDLEQELVNIKEKNFNLEREMDLLKKNISEGEEKNKDLSSLVGSLQKKLADERLNTSEESERKAELNKALFTIKELELRLENAKSAEEKFDSDSKAIVELPKLQKEMKKIKEENSTLRLTRVNSELLEEKLKFSENQYTSSENRCKQLIDENASLVALRSVTEEVEKILKAELNLEYIPPSSELTSMIRNLKKNDCGVSDSISELKMSLNSHQSTLEERNKELDLLKEEKKSDQEKIQSSSTLIGRLQRKMFLISKERDSLKNIISTYESESTLNPSALEQEKVSHYEAQLKSYKAENEKLETELNQYQKLDKHDLPFPKKTALSDSSSSRTAEIDGLHKRIQTLIDDKQALLDQIEELGVKGGFDPRDTKVIHSIDNPVEKANRERQMKLENVTKENEALKTRIKLLEEGEKEDLTSKVGSKVNYSEASVEKIKELEDKLKTMEIRNERILDSFKRKSHELREVMYRLTGYRFDIREDNHYKLINIYSDSNEDYLLFEQTTEGDLQLLETDYSTTLEDLIESYLHQDNSYPAFLSALTLQLFDKQNVAENSSDEEGDERRDQDDEYEDMDRGNSDSNDGADEQNYDDDERSDDSEWDQDNEDGGPSSKRPRMDSDESEEEIEEEEQQEQNYQDDDDDDDLICLD